MFGMTTRQLRARFNRLGVLMRKGTPKEARQMMLWPALWEYERQQNERLV
jgi:hypothetical protein